MDPNVKQEITKLLNDIKIDEEEKEEEKYENSTPASTEIETKECK